MHIDTSLFSLVSLFSWYIDSHQKPRCFVAQKETKNKKNTFFSRIFFFCVMSKWQNHQTQKEERGIETIYSNAGETIDLYNTTTKRFKNLRFVEGLAMDLRFGDLTKSSKGGGQRQIFSLEKNRKKWIDEKKETFPSYCIHTRWLITIVAFF